MGGNLLFFLYNNKKIIKLDYFLNIGTKRKIRIPPKRENMGLSEGKIENIVSR